MNRNKKERYVFSFVIPIYNVEDYLAETVESILAQTLDFENNCEIVFVNDGSPDDSEAICLRYKELFPRNVKYIKQKNGGLSAARNTGIEAAEGRYVSFIDPDDKLSPGAIQEVYAFFEEHYDEIDFVSIKIQMFEARTDGHLLNYRFDRSRVIDIQEEPSLIQQHAASAFVKADALRRGHRFDKEIRKFAEDMKFMTELVLDKMAYGVVSKATYLYRKREAGGSIMDSERSSRVWYTDIPHQVHDALLAYGKKKQGLIPKYVQHVVMHDIQWRFRQEKQNVLSNTELEKYKALLISIAKRIDDDVILAQRHMPDEYKFFVLSKIHDLSVSSGAKRKGLSFLFNGSEIYNFNKVDPTVHIEMLESDGRTMKLEGYFNGFLFADTKLKFRVGDEWFDIKKVRRVSKELYFFDELIYDRNAFVVEVPLKENVGVMAYVVAGDQKKVLRLIPHRHARFSSASYLSYRVFGDVVVTLARRSFVVSRKTVKRQIGREFRRSVELLNQGRFESVAERLIAFLIRPFLNKKIWIISDRSDAGGDNGEALFKFVTKQRNSQIKAYFAVSKTSEDYRRIRKTGPILTFGGLKYKVLFVLADKVISSHADEHVINPFGTRLMDMVDRLEFDFVFLQHGITQNDISTWINRSNKDIKLLVAAAKPEYEAFLDEKYGYNENVVKLLGFARYDLLKDDRKGKLIIAPTWRAALTGEVDKLTSIRGYNVNFKGSAYFDFYQQLIADERIRSTLRKHGMAGEFYLHPAHISQIDDFKGNDEVLIKQAPYDYKMAFSEGDIMLTDYSSVAFDFAYLKKPVIYSQFDKEDFYGKHVWEPDYFSYEDDGFGPVTYDYETTVESIIKSIENGCTIENVYRKRAERFFYKFDKDNCKRIYHAVLNI